MTHADKIALLADVHGNVAALSAVIADVQAQAVDRYVIVGDSVTNGPRPNETLDWVQALDAPAIIGNNDLEVINGTDPAASWARQRLDKLRIAYLRALPLTYQVTPPGDRAPCDDLLVVHASPRSCNDLLILELHPLGTSFTRATPADEAEVMLAGAEANLVVYGHIHYASKGCVNGQRLVSVGSVGFPFDGDTRAAYALASWDGCGWYIEHRRVVYDHKAVAEDIEHSGQPFPERYAKMIREANWFPHPSG